MAKILVSGCAGFIGFHCAKRLLEQGAEVVGLESLNDFYDVNLKKARLSQLTSQPRFQFFRMDISDCEGTSRHFRDEKFNQVVHLAAQAGVRYSLINPHAYVSSNVVGFANILEGCRHNGVKHLVFASSSSVYGANTKVPFSVHDKVDHPISFYAATKKANELMAHAYAHLYGLPCTGLRFFTVYGPWGRPDMALFLFTKAILEDKPIDVFNYGEMRRDFTYIDDVVDGVLRVLEKIPQPDPEWKGEHPDCGTSSAPYRIYNFANHKPVNLIDFVHKLESKLYRKAIINFLPMQAGDVPATFADVDDLVRDVNFKPQTSIKDGIGHFIDWYQSWYRILKA